MERKVAGKFLFKREEMLFFNENKSLLGCDSNEKWHYEKNQLEQGSIEINVCLSLLFLGVLKFIIADVSAQK